RRSAVEVAANAIAEVDRFADVDDPARAVLHQVHAGLVGQRVELFFEGRHLPLPAKRGEGRGEGRTFCNRALKCATTERTSNFPASFEETRPKPSAFCGRTFETRDLATSSGGSIRSARGSLISPARNGRSS